MNKKELAELITEYKELSEHSLKGRSYISENYDEPFWLFIQSRMFPLIFTEGGQELVDWWVYDSSKKVLYKGKRETKVETAEQLADYLIKNKAYYLR